MHVHRCSVWFVAPVKNADAENSFFVVSPMRGRWNEFVNKLIHRKCKSGLLTPTIELAVNQGLCLLFRAMFILRISNTDYEIVHHMRRSYLCVQKYIMAVVGSVNAQKISLF